MKSYLSRQKPWPRLLFAGCLVFSVTFASWLMVHTFSYDVGQSAMLIATKAWSDFGAHIPLIRSFSLGHNWPPQYPIFPGEPIRYHFLFYLCVGVLERIGLRIDIALNLLSIVGFSALLMGICVLAHHLFHDIRVTVLSLVFFLFNGSCSFVRFFQTHPFSSNTITDIVTNTKFPSFAPWDTGDISAFWNLNIYTNQRHLGAAFALGILFILVLVFIEKKPWRKQIPFLLPEVGIIALLPFFHQPTLIIIAIVMCWYFFAFPNIRRILMLIGALGIAAALPQVLSLTAGPKTVAWHPWYLMDEPHTVFHAISYWFNNIGLHLLFIPIGWALAPKRVKHITLPIFFIFLFGMCFQCSIEMAANHKFFNFFLIIGNILSAYALVRVYTTVSHQIHRHPWNVYSASAAIALFLCTVAVVGSMTMSGIIDLFPIANDTYIPLVDIPKNEVATWIRDNTPPDAVFLNSGFFFHPASIAGRKIFMGWPYFPWSAGYDTYLRTKEMQQMYDTRQPYMRCVLLRSHNISYVTVENISHDANLPNISLDDYADYTPVYTASSGSYAIFAVDDLCK